MKYEYLQRAYDSAQKVCDPLTFINKQKTLLGVIAEYLLARDAPPEEKEDEVSAFKVIK